MATLRFMTNICILLQEKTGERQGQQLQHRIFKGELVVEIQGHPNYCLYSDPDVTLSLERTDISSLEETELNYLLAVEPSSVRLEQYQSNKKEEIMGLKVGDVVMFNLDSLLITRGMIRYIGCLDGYNGIHFGIEILVSTLNNTVHCDMFIYYIQDDRHRGRGTTDGGPHFYCDANNAVYVAMDKIVQKSHLQDSIPQTPVTNLLRRARSNTWSSYLRQAFDKVFQVIDSEDPLTENKADKEEFDRRHNGLETLDGNDIHYINNKPEMQSVDDIIISSCHSEGMFSLDHLKALNIEKKERMKCFQEIENLPSDLEKQNHELNNWLSTKFDQLSNGYQELWKKLEEEVVEKKKMQNEICSLKKELQKQQEMLEQIKIKLQTKEEENNFLQQKITTVDNSWKVSFEELVFTRETLGKGAWGAIWVAVYQESRVAVKQTHDLIITEDTQEATLELIHREINTMAQLRHPNLLQFIGAVLDDPSGNPMIITEIMDTSLRNAYETKQLTPHPSCEPVLLTIIRDVAVGLNYLHCLPDPVIHRDVSSANVLLESKGPHKWKTKISDFGSANKARQAVTRGTGTLVYSAPESVPSIHVVDVQKALTTKMDVHSYGILFCEIMNCRFPDPSVFKEMLQYVHSRSPHLHEFILSCIEKNPEDRPTMKEVIQQLDNDNN